MILIIMVTDYGTEVSDKAFDTACEFAGRCGAYITLLHVIADIEDPDT
jgi:nucleotide-binding universal stress UspA family protein